MGNHHRLCCWQLALWLVQAETEYNGTTYKYYYYIDQDTGLVDNACIDETFSVLDHTEIGAPTPQNRIHPNLVAQVCTIVELKQYCGHWPIGTPRMPRTPRTPSNNRASSGKVHVQWNRIRWEFEDEIHIWAYDVSKHASSGNSSASGKAVVAASNPNELTKSNSPVKWFWLLQQRLVYVWLRLRRIHARAVRYGIWRTSMQDTEQVIHTHYTAGIQNVQTFGYWANENQHEWILPRTVEPKAGEILGEETSEDVQADRLVSMM